MMRIMDIGWDARGRFAYRENRFLAYADVAFPYGEKNVPVHVHDPGRLREILIEGTELLLRKANAPGRKTGWDVIAASIDSTWAIINSSLHSEMAHTLFSMGVLPFCSSNDDIRREVRCGESRLDFLISSGEARTWVEVKGCTLTCDGVALFPDAPTKRGSKHLKELCAMKDIGDDAAVVFLVLGPKADTFSPNRETDPLFSDLLANAHTKGVKIYPLQLFFDSSTLYFDSILPLNL